MRTVAIQIITLSLAMIQLISCREDSEVNAGMHQGSMKVTLSVSNPAGTEGGTAGTTTISKIAAYRFEEGVLAEMLEGVVPDAAGVCLMPLKKQAGMLYCLANVSEKVTTGRFEPGVTQLDHFLLLAASDTEMASHDHISLMGSQEISPNRTMMPLKRTVARVDLSTPLNNVQVHRVKVSRIADRGYLYPQHNNAAPQGVQYKDSLFEFAQPLISTTHPLLYLCEQENTMLEFEIDVSSGGGLQRLRTRLPDKIVRNTVYTLKVCGSGSKLDVEVQSADWNYGTITESDLEPTIQIDVEASSLPEGVNLNNTHDTVRISFRQNAFDLALSVDEGRLVTINGTAQGVTTIVHPPTLGLKQTIHVSVTKEAKLLGRPEETIFLDVSKGDTYTGRIVMIFESHPVRLTGQLNFKNTPLAEFEDYIDGEIGVLTLPKGWSVSSSIDDPNEPWMKLMSAAENPQEMRILAGWRPNDPHADGHVQEAKLILSDGAHTEEYIIRRRNWGLPVVNIDGTWWCKYNLRGSSIDFTNQILPKDDSLMETKLYEHLQNCPEDELLDLLGHQYQGGYPQGLPLAWDESGFYYEGMRNSVPGFFATADSLMVPRGYRVPRNEDYLTFSNSINFNLGKPGTRSFQNAKGQEVTVSISMRNVRFLGQEYGIIGFYEFRVGDAGDRIVLYGLRPQFSTIHDQLSQKSILLATKIKTDWSWGIVGGKGDANGLFDSSINYNIHKEIKTRTLRAIKEPVEYIY